MSKENLDPVDDSVPIPASVKAAAARAEAIHKEAYHTEEPPKAAIEAAPPPVIPVAPASETPVETVASPTGEAVVQSTIQPAITPPAEPAPVQPAAEVTAPVTPPVENWEHRYLSMKGRFDQSQHTVGALQQQLTEMGDELIRMQNVRAQQPEPRPEPQPILTEEERKTYGEDLINVMRKAAMETVQPELDAVKQANQQLRQRLAQTANTGLAAELTAAVPTWREVKENPRFHTWLRLPDIYSGQLRVNLLKAATQAASAPRVIAFYKGFLAEEQATGQMSPAPQPQAGTMPPRVAAVPLDTLAAPGKARPATGDTSMPADKPIYTHRQVAGFYSQVRQGVYAGREAEKAALEADIIAAGREGRIR